MLLLAALLLPLRQLSCPAGKKRQPLSSYIIRESIKWRNKDLETTALLHEVAPELLQLHRLLQDAGAGRARRPRPAWPAPAGCLTAPAGCAWADGLQRQPAALTGRRAA
jgi:hypothetical protein